MLTAVENCALCGVSVVYNVFCFVSVLKEVEDDKTCSQLENQLKLLLSRLDVSSVVRTRKIFCFCSCLIRSTSPSRPNKAGLRCPPLHPSVRPLKGFFDFNEIWYVGSGR